MEQSNKKVRVSFDVDGTLFDFFDGTKNPYKERLQNLFKSLHANENIEVYIITRRFDVNNSHKGSTNEHLDVIKFAQEIDFPVERVFFTNRNYKFSKIKELNINIHLDDEELEIHYIKHWTGAKGIHLEKSDWEEKFETALKFHS